MERRIDAEVEAEVVEAAKGQTLSQIAKGLLDAVDPDKISEAAVGRLSSAGGPSASAGSGGPVPPPGAPTPEHQFTRIPRCWRWQAGFHDHKFRTPESEARKWEYVCLNPVRYHLVQRPQEWPYGGEIFYDDAAGPRLVPGTPPLLETGILIEKDGTPRQGRSEPPREGTRPTA